MTGTEQVQPEQGKPTSVGRLALMLLALAVVSTLVSLGVYGLASLL